MLRIAQDDGNIPDSPTMEWLASEEFPHRAVRAESSLPSSHAFECDATDAPDAPTQDWLLSQEFPRKRLLFNGPAPEPARPRRKAPLFVRSSRGVVQVSMERTRAFGTAPDSQAGWELNGFVPV